LAAALNTITNESTCSCVGKGAFPLNKYRRSPQRAFFKNAGRELANDYFHAAIRTSMDETGVGCLVHAAAKSFDGKLKFGKDEPSNNPPVVAPPRF